MKTQLPGDCGNSPRITIVGEFATAWAAGDADAMGEWLADDAEWVVAGGESFAGADAVSGGLPPEPVESLEVNTIITHGRLASCDGVLETADGTVAFSLTLRFAGATKTAKIREVRSYLFR
jgi:ketosteroid isomerase-like protein